MPMGAQRRYPGWKPRVCLRCRGRENNRGNNGFQVSPGESEKPPARASTAIYTDGSCQGNPGPGGWGAVYVEGDEVIEERRGFDPQTTNNRMELTGVIQGLKMAPQEKTVVLYTDSNLTVQTLTSWAGGWEKRGWRRRDGEVKNLDLVKEAYELLKGRPNVHLEWVKGHAGDRWNEYADALSTAHVRDDLDEAADAKPAG